MPLSLSAIYGATSAQRLGSPAIDVLSQLVRIPQGAVAGVRMTMLDGFTDDLSDGVVVFYFSKTEPGTGSNGDFSVSSEGGGVVFPTADSATATLPSSGDTVVDGDSEAMAGEWVASVFWETGGQKDLLAQFMVEMVPTAKELD